MACKFFGGLTNVSWQATAKHWIGWHWGDNDCGLQVHCLSVSVSAVGYKNKTQVLQSGHTFEHVTIMPSLKRKCSTASQWWMRVLTISHDCILHTLHITHRNIIITLPDLTLPSGWTGVICPALRPYLFGPVCNPDVTIGHRASWWFLRTVKGTIVLSCLTRQVRVDVMQSWSIHPAFQQDIFLRSEMWFLLPHHITLTDKHSH